MITSGIRFFEQAHIKDAVAFLKLTTQPRDELAFKRLAKMLPGIGGKGADKLWTAFSSELDATPEFPDVPKFSSPPPSDESGEMAPENSLPASLPSVPIAPLLIRASVQKAVPKKAQVAWAQFVATLSQLEDPDTRNLPAKMLQLVLDAGYTEYLEAHYERHRARLDDIQQLRQYAQRFTTTAEFLSELALQTNIEAEAQADTARDDEERLRLSTIHQAKGLEFGAVFVIMLCEGLFPSEHVQESLTREEEERRLFYVAVTRAKDHLYLSYPLIRSLGGNAGIQRTRPSRFLQDLPHALFEEWNLRPYYSTGNRQRPPIDEDPPEDQPF
jgi:DNA helicase-2/ATP-dependent DNA helicase PcrA